jgi:hypothetical protein
VSALVPFFRLWPESLQLQLSRVLHTEVLVKQESVLARGTPCTRVVFNTGSASEPSDGSGA